MASLAAIAALAATAAVAAPPAAIRLASPSAAGPAAPRAADDIVVRLLVSREGQARYVDESFLFQANDRFRILVTAGRNGYLYIFNPTNDGQAAQLFPDARINNGDNRVPARSEYSVPVSAWFGFQDQAHVEEVYIFLSTQPIPELEELTRSVRRAAGGAGAKAGGMPKADGAPAAPELPRGPSLISGFLETLDKLQVRKPRGKSAPKPKAKVVGKTAPRDADDPREGTALGDDVTIKILRLRGQGAVDSPVPPIADPNPMVPTTPVTPPPAATTTMQRVRALLIADTRANIGDSCRADLENFKATLERHLTGTPLTVEALTGRDVTPEKITTTLRGMAGQLKADDTLLVYYAGHGAWVDGQGHHLTLTGRTQRDYLFVPRDDIRRAMTASGAGLTVLITDCCANIVPASLVRPQALTVQSKNLAGGQVLRALLLQHSGVVDINAAEKGTFALGNNLGGCFTRAFCDLAGRNVAELPPPIGGRTGVTFVSWSEFFTPLREQTFQNSQAASSDPTREPPHRPEALELNVRALVRP